MSLNDLLAGDFRVPDCPCPGCGEFLGGAMGPQQPKPGDYSVCAHCALILRFKEDLTLRAATDEELLADDCPPDLHMVQQLCLELIAQKG